MFLKRELLTLCSGSLITVLHVLTAAHCTCKKKEKKPNIKGMIVTVVTTEQKERIFHTTDVEIPDNYICDDEFSPSDIAVLTVNSNIVENFNLFDLPKLLSLIRKTIFSSLQRKSICHVMCI